MIAFWIAAALLSAAVAALVVHFSGREPQAARVDPAASVYRRQLDEIDEMAGRGLLADEEREAARAEAARRLLGAGEVVAEAPPTRQMRIAILGAAVAAAVLAAVVYLFIGAPGQPDQPFKRRAAEWLTAARDDPGALGAERLAVLLKDAVAKNPEEWQPLYYLAMAQVESGQVQLGIHNLKKAAALAPNQPNIWASLGEAQTLAAADQSVSPEASVAFSRALQLDPKGVRPRYYLARAKIERGDVAGGLADWRALSADLPPGSGEAQAIQAEIARVEGVGPTTVEASPQQAMIQQMVEGLAARLKQDPNDAQGWARLIRSYAVLGDKAKMNAALDEARRIFKDRPSDRAAIESAAEKPQ
jgi:cytochrome c-type biogenesis protein CcmH